jgi:hypothetical protein
MSGNTWGSGRLEFLALQGEIEKRIQSGRSIRAVYMELCDEGKITMTYTTFYRHCRKSNFVVGSNIDFETLQRSKLTPEQEKAEQEEREAEELREIARKRLAQVKARQEAKNG